MITGRSNTKGFYILGESPSIVVETENFSEGDEEWEFSEKLLEEKRQRFIGKTWGFCVVMCTSVCVATIALYWSYSSWSLAEKIVLLVLLLFVEILVLTLASILLGDAIANIIYRKLDIFENRSFKEWHACEHKVIALLLRGEELTLENLQKMPIFTPICGAGRKQSRILEEPSPDKLEEGFRVAIEFRSKMAGQ